MQHSEHNQAQGYQTQEGERPLLRLPIEGMSCASCSSRLEKKLALAPGVLSANVNFATETATISYDPSQTTTKDITHVVQETGYQVAQSTERLNIEGMSCSSCVARVEKAIRAVPGVIDVEVNFASEQARIQLSSQTSQQVLIEAIVNAGYGARAPATNSAQSQDESLARGKKARTELAALLASAALTLPLIAPMILGVFGIEWALAGTDQLLFATPVQVFGGARFYRGTWSALKAKNANMDVLVALGTTAAFGLSLFLLDKSSHLYFESSAAVITFVLFGKWLEARAKRSTSQAIRALMDLRPLIARLRVPEGEREVPADSIVRGDVVIVRPGEQIPVDGRIIEGMSHIDESLINGESLPVVRAQEDTVIGGSVNGEGLLAIEATQVAEESMLSRILTLVQNAQAKRAPIQRKVDKVAAIFVPVVLLISLLAFLGWLGSDVGVERAMIYAVSVLVIACPCALGLATPAALMVGTGAAARAGILIQDAEALELARSVEVVVLDKTGTLTEGRPQVQEILADDANHLLTLAAAAQKGSEHPLAEAIRISAKERGLNVPSVTDFKATAGKGVEAYLNGKLISIGSPRWTIERGLDFSRFKERAAQLEAGGMTVAWIAEDSIILGGIALGDNPRPTSQAAVARLHAMGIETIMLTGDNRAAADSVGQRLGVGRVLAEVLPEEKSNEIVRLRKLGKVVAMVGDGINDAPALAAADVSFAMGTGTDVAMQTAGVTLMRPDPHLIADAILISQATTRKIHQNLFWAFGYNVVGIPLAALGFLSPMIAGAAMALSSVSVLGNALLLRRWKATR